MSRQLQSLFNCCLTKGKFYNSFAYCLLLESSSHSVSSHALHQIYFTALHKTPNRHHVSPHLLLPLCQWIEFAFFVKALHVFSKELSFHCKYYIWTNMTRIRQILIFQIHFVVNSQSSEKMIFVGDDRYLRQDFYLPLQNYQQTPPHLLKS